MNYCACSVILLLILLLILLPFYCRHWTKSWISYSTCVTGHAKDVQLSARVHSLILCYEIGSFILTIVECTHSSLSALRCLGVKRDQESPPLALKADVGNKDHRVISHKFGVLRLFRTCSNHSTTHGSRPAAKPEMSSGWFDSSELLQTTEIWREQRS